MKLRVAAAARSCCCSCCRAEAETTAATETASQGIADEDSSQARRLEEVEHVGLDKKLN